MVSIFVCAICDRYADSDDGCEVVTPLKDGHFFDLICVDCADEMDDDERDWCEAIEPSQHHSKSEGK